MKLSVFSDCFPFGWLGNEDGWEDGTEEEATMKIRPSCVHLTEGDCDLDGVAAKISHEHSILRFFGDLKKSNIVFFTGVP